MANQAYSTQVASARLYLFRVVNPFSHHSLTIATETPTKALALYGLWFGIHPSQVAISRRSPMMEAAR